MGAHPRFSIYDNRILAEHPVFNRIILFYHDAEVSAEYTPVGYFDYTEEFVDAVENNPVVEGWGNKIVIIAKE